MPSLLLVAIGGALGAVARAVISTSIQARWPSTLPWGTLTVNVSGCLALGVLSGALASRPDVAPAWRALGAVGMLGAFTTFSTFEHETLALLERGATGAACANVGISLLAGLVAVWLGQGIGRML